MNEPSKETLRLTVALALELGTYGLLDLTGDLLEILADAALATIDDAAHGDFCRVWNDSEVDVAFMTRDGDCVPFAEKAARSGFTDLVDSARRIKHAQGEGRRLALAELAKIGGNGPPWQMLVNIALAEAEARARRTEKGPGQ